MMRAYISGPLVCAFLLCGTGCETTTDPSQEESEEYINPATPNSNGRIMSQRTYGDPAMPTYIRRIEPDRSGGYFVHGRVNDQHGVGRLSAGGEMSWFTEVGHDVRDHVVLPATAVVPNGIIAVGVLSGKPKADSYSASVSLIGPDGALLSQVSFSDASSGLWVNTIALTSDSTAILGGGSDNSRTYLPLVAAIKLTGQGVLEKAGAVVQGARADQFISDIVTEAAPGGDVTAFAISPRAELDVLAIDRFSIPNGDVTALSVTWSRGLWMNEGRGTFASSAGSIALYDGNLYVAGYFRDPRKPSTASGSYWSTGFVASLTTGGDKRWTTLAWLTNNSDQYFTVFPTPGGLYAVGSAGTFLLLSSRESFGYGLVSKFDLDSGKPLSHRTFGSDRYQSLFGHLLVENDVGHAVGRTRKEIDGGGYLGWFAEVDLSAGRGPGTSMH